MTRTYLVKLANQIISNPIKSFTDPSYFGIMHISKFKNKEIVVLADIDGVAVAVVYNKTLYCLVPVGYKGAGAIKSVYELYKCKTKVYLYPNSRNMLFRDEYGEFCSYKLANLSFKIDYSDCIPMPYPKI